MEKLNKLIDWKRINSLLLSHYTLGTSSEGDVEYPTILKCLLLKKWFYIDSQPELENKINYRLSFIKFFGLSFRKPSLDHSTFCCFKARLSKETMNQVNSEIFRQFESRKVTINEGIAFAARLAKSTSHRISNNKIKEAKDKHNTPECELDKNGKPLKFQRNLDSNWAMQKDTPN